MLVFASTSGGLKMVNKLSDLALFLEDQSIPLWVKDALRQKAVEIRAALEHGESYKLIGPKGEEITIAPKAAVAA